LTDTVITLTVRSKFAQRSGQSTLTVRSKLDHGEVKVRSLSGQNSLSGQVKVHSRSGQNSLAVKSKYARGQVLALEHRSLSSYSPNTVVHLFYLATSFKIPWW